MIVLNLLPTFDYTAAGRQVSLLAPFLRETVAVHVAGLAGNGPIAELLGQSGAQVHALGATRRIDLAAALALRRLIRDLRPDIVHAWRLPALRAAGLLHIRRKSTFHLVASDPRRGGRLTLFDRWLLRAVDAVIAGNSAVAAAFCRIGVASEHVHELPFAVVPAAAEPPLGLSLPPAAKIIMCVGTLSAAHGFRDAVWAADILRYPIPNLHLVIVGDGPDRARLARFALGINPAGGHVHFLPARPEAAALLTHADVVWVPSRSACGRQVLLEALAAGRPTVATALPGLSDLVTDGRNGLLVPPGDPLALARRTRQLLENAPLAAQLGAAGREFVAGNTPERVAMAYADLYKTVGR